MAKTTNPFLGGFDFADVAKMFDPAKFDLESLASSFKLPNVDTNVVIEIQRKNLEAVTAANKIALEGAQTIARRQAEIVREAVKGMGDATNAITSAKTVEEKLVKQADFVKAAYAKNVADIRELSELGAKSGREAFEVINSRVTEGLEEFGKQVKKAA